MGTDLSGRTAIVTGASRGIGRAIATRLAARGAAVVVGYLRNTELLLGPVEQPLRVGRLGEVAPDGDRPAAFAR